jgi:hypothetical protein
MSIALATIRCAKRLAVHDQTQAANAILKKLRERI